MSSSKEILQLVMKRGQSDDPSEVREAEARLHELTGTDWSELPRELPRILSPPPEFGSDQTLSMVGGAWTVSEREEPKQVRRSAEPPRASAEGRDRLRRAAYGESSGHAVKESASGTVRPSQSKRQPRTSDEPTVVGAVGDLLAALWRLVPGKSIPGRVLGLFERSGTRDKQWGVTKYLWVAVATAYLTYGGTLRVGIQNGLYELLGQSLHDSFMWTLGWVFWVAIALALFGTWRNR